MEFLDFGICRHRVSEFLFNILKVLLRFFAPPWTLFVKARLKQLEKNRFRLIESFGIRAPASALRLLMLR